MCTPEPSLGAPDAELMGISYRKRSNCPCAVVGGCGDEVSSVDECDNGDASVWVKDVCCREPSLCTYCCNSDFGFRQERECGAPGDNKVFMQTSAEPNP
jgi:hypothetical protein